MRCGISRRTTYLQSRNQAEFLRRSVQAASGALRIAGEQYQQAATSFTTVLTAEQKLLQAQNSLAGASANIPFGLDAPIVYLASPWRSAFIRERASPGCRAQNSTHPGGGCVTSDSRTWASRSGSATAGSASMALAASTAIKTIPDFAFKALKIMAATFM